MGSDFGFDLGFSVVGEQHMLGQDIGGGAGSVITPNSTADR
jgi:hypothetical protein